MRLRVPTVEVSDYGHVPRIGGPDAEDGALGPLGFHEVRAHLLVNAIVVAFVE
jgi:hypothetical protein